MPKKKTTRSTGKALTTTAAPRRDLIRPMHGGGELVHIDAVFNVPAVHPSEPGPWAGEADKIAWTDAMTGLGCIIRRSPRGQHLCGYVSVPPGHPLFGRNVGTLGDHLIGVHGGLDYSAACQASEPEEISICHPGDGDTLRLVSPTFRQKVHANEAAESGDDAWWFGFSCDKAGDVKPAAQARRRADQLLDGVVDLSYKTEAFVYRECVRLAAQLKAIGEGRDPRDADPGPIAIDQLSRQNGGGRS